MNKRLKTSRYITGFDGIRTLAVIGVILYHLLPTQMRGGYLGVPVFFVVSGYLITDLLRQEWDQNGRIAVKDFYVRRMKRLYPGMVVMLLLSAAYITLFQRNLLNNLRGVVVSSLLYVNNWWQINHGLSYFDRFGNESPFTHLWSLAVEGQNYLIWPLLFILLMKLVKNRGTIFKIVIGCSLLSALLLAIWYSPGADPTRVYYGTDTRLFSIWMGSALAFIWPSTHLKKEIPKKAKRVLNLAGGLSFIGLVITFFVLDDHLSFVYYGGMLLVSLLCTILVAVTAHPGASLNRWLTNPLFSYIGKRSYGIYLYQFPVMIFYEAKIGNVGENVLLHTLIEIVLILLISELSYRFIENPLRKFHYKDTFRTVRNWFSKPVISRQKPWLLPGLLVSLVALYGIATAPVNYVDAQQQQLKENIAANKKVAEQTQKNANGSDTESTGENSSKATEAEQSVMEKYGLTEAQVKKAEELEITAFGDSVMLDATADLQEIFPKAVVDGDVGRQLYESPELIKALKEKDLLRDTVLIGLGTNGSFTETQFDNLMKEIGDRKVYWINVRVPTQRWQNEVNSMLEKMAAKYDNMTLIDWYDLSNEHEEWFYEDRVHPNPDGMLQYCTLVSQAILQ
ncbi:MULTISPECIES: acyltransferase family protein [Enterococcus]|uniref:acyltransferase family protein n=1 Tax=Enterococcus TaxID=1350 RepID=UPI000E3F011C|nr:MULTISPECIES: acyltransferase family protein [Enterococcus]AYY09742.1 acetyltransferase [Enterococcus sp. FDAARGOS_553]MDO6298922.1 acyltransferase family protein [Enterococcus gallinarum]RGC44793.1 acetyltransferase [Enterococcus gallinarum]